nr:unnamed protein product [Digitaria exilis]
MEVQSPPPSPLSALRDRLRATVCCCFGQLGGGGLGERMRWRRSSGGGEFRYDPLSYALNFDEGGDLDDADEEEDMDVMEGMEFHAGRRDGLLLYQSFSSRLSTPVEVIEIA